MLHNNSHSSIAVRNTILFSPAQWSFALSPPQPAPGVQQVSSLSQPLSQLHLPFLWFQRLNFPFRETVPLNHVLWVGSPLDIICISALKEGMWPMPQESAHPNPLITMSSSGICIQSNLAQPSPARISIGPFGLRVAPLSGLRTTTV